MAAADAACSPGEGAGAWRVPWISSRARPDGVCRRVGRGLDLASEFEGENAVELLVGCRAIDGISYYTRRRDVGQFMTGIRSFARYQQRAKSSETCSDYRVLRAYSVLALKLGGLKVSLGGEKGPRLALWPLT